MITDSPTPSSSAAQTPREQEIRRWLRECLGGDRDDITTVSGDASFRRYYRHRRGTSSWIVMDAPPAQESCTEFVAIARHLRMLGLQAPEVYASDFERGLLLLSDLGDRQYLGELNADSADRLYGTALDVLERLQTDRALLATLPPYDEALLRDEMALFGEWFLGHHLSLDTEDWAPILAPAEDRLVANALEQPTVMVHRDYHSRNLMILEGEAPGILDFQDAVVGPVTYDLVSLLRDCYIVWPPERVEAWLQAYRQRPNIVALIGEVDADRWRRWFDLMGLQRHLKCAGIFARLYYRDGKPGYLKDIPLTVQYLIEASAAYPEFADLHRLLTDRIAPALAERESNS